MIGLEINFTQCIPLKSYNETQFVAFARFVVTPDMRIRQIILNTIICQLSGLINYVSDSDNYNPGFNKIVLVVLSDILC